LSVAERLRSSEKWTSESTCQIAGAWRSTCAAGVGGCAAAAARGCSAASRQGLPLVHSSAQRKHFLSDALGSACSVIDKNGSGSSQKWTSVSPCLCAKPGGRHPQGAPRASPSRAARPRHAGACGARIGQPARAVFYHSLLVAWPTHHHEVETGRELRQPMGGGSQGAAGAGMRRAVRPRSISGRRTPPPSPPRRQTPAPAPAPPRVRCDAPRPIRLTGARAAPPARGGTEGGAMPTPPPPRLSTAVTVAATPPSRHGRAGRHDCEPRPVEAGLMCGAVVVRGCRRRISTREG